MLIKAMNIIGDKNKISIEINKTEFNKLREDFYSYRLLSKYDSLKYKHKCNNIVVRNVFMNLCKSLTLKSIEDAFNKLDSDNKYLELVLCTTKTEQVSIYRKYIQMIIELFANDINMDMLNYTDMVCSYRVK